MMELRTQIRNLLLVVVLSVVTINIYSQPGMYSVYEDQEPHPWYGYSESKGYPSYDPFFYSSNTRSGYRHYLSDSVKTRLITLNEPAFTWIVPHSKELMPLFFLNYSCYYISFKNYFYLGKRPFKIMDYSAGWYSYKDWQR